MMDGVKGGRYDVMDIIQSIKSGRILVIQVKVLEVC